MGNACSRIKLLVNNYYVKLNDKKNTTSYQSQEHNTNQDINADESSQNPYNYNSSLCNCKYKNKDQSNKKVLICEYCYDRLDKVLFI